VKLVEILLLYREKALKFFELFPKASADVFAWISIVVLCLCNVPGYYALMTAVTDTTPPLDISLIVWIGLLLYFIRSAILKDMVMVATIGIGFAVQLIFLGLIFFL
jgi:hypothetical protein